MLDIYVTFIVLDIRIKYPTFVRRGTRHIKKVIAETLFAPRALTRPQFKPNGSKKSPGLRVISAEACVNGKSTSPGGTAFTRWNGGYSVKLALAQKKKTNLQHAQLSLVQFFLLFSHSEICYGIFPSYL
jgi:hypothetical protein